MSEDARRVIYNQHDEALATPLPVQWERSERNPAWHLKVGLAMIQDLMMCTSKPELDAAILRAYRVVRLGLEAVESQDKAADE